MIESNEFEHLCSFPKIIAQTEGTSQPGLIENTDQGAGKRTKVNIAVAFDSVRRPWESSLLTICRVPAATAAGTV
jgi:hypothetical protein